MYVSVCERRGVFLIHYFIDPISNDTNPVSTSNKGNRDIQAIGQRNLFYFYDINFLHFVIILDWVGHKSASGQWRAAIRVGGVYCAAKSSRRRSTAQPQFADLL